MQHAVMQGYVRLCKALTLMISLINIHLGDQIYSHRESVVSGMSLASDHGEPHH